MHSINSINSLQPVSKNPIYVADLLKQRHPGVFQDMQAFLPRSELLTFPGGKDVWCRDYLPICVAPGEYVQFNYQPSYLKHNPELRTPPDAVPFVQSLGRVEQSNLILDGGNCVMGPNRAILTNQIYRDNPDWKRPALRKELKRLLRVEHLTIIPREPGDLFGHSDGMVRFRDEKSVLIHDSSKLEPKFHNRLRTCLEKAGLEVHLVPYAPSEEKSSDGVPSASGLYLNFIQTAHQVLVPVFGLPEDGLAKETLSRAFPNHEMIPIHCESLAKEGGLLHCVSWQPTPASQAFQHTPFIESKRSKNIRTIYPYLEGDSWFFDDDETGLIKEEFVRGADALLQELVDDCWEPEKGFELTFSAEPFGATEHLIWLRSEDNGNWYLHVGTGLEAWLCPSLLLYYEEAPAHLYFELQPLVTSNR